MRRLHAALIAVVAISSALIAQSSLDHEISANRSDLSLESGRMQGPGADKLRAALADTNFVFLGEDHGIAQVAEFADALYTELHGYGFNTLALEIGPATAAELGRELRSSDPDASQRLFLQQHPMTIAFYNTSEEFRFLKHAAALSGSRFTLIGFDQELMGSARLLLESTSRQRLTPTLKQQLQALLDQEHAALATALSSGRPDRLYMMTASEDDLRAYGTALKKAERDSSGVDRLLESRGIYSEFFKDGYQSNVMRDALMKRYFVSAGGLTLGKVMLKGGAEHGWKGLGPVNTFELGNFVSEVAAGRDQGSVHILVAGIGGEQLVFAGAGRPMQPRPLRMNSKDYALPALQPFAAAVTASDRWSVFDFRPLRKSFRPGAAADPRIERLVFGYDFLVLIPDPRAATEIQGPDAGTAR